MSTTDQKPSSTNIYKASAVRRGQTLGGKTQNKTQTGINAGELEESLAVSLMPMQISLRLMTARSHKQSSVDVFILGRSRGGGVLLHENLPRDLQNIR